MDGIGNGRLKVMVLRNILLFMLVALVFAGLGGCYNNAERVNGMDTGNDEQKILGIIDTYVKAVNTADADLLESLFWKDDPRFTEVENDIPMPFGEKTFSELRDWVRKNGKPGNNQRFYDTTLHMLSAEIAYSVSMRDEYYGEEPSSSRVTLVYLKKSNEWKIIHGHFSYVPE